MLRPIRILLFIFTMTALCACKRKAREIPIADFFKTPEKSAFKISPDGKYISYLKPYKDKQNIFIKSLADGKERMATSFIDYSVRNDYFWAYNGEIVFSQDIIALDQFKLFALDIATLKTNNIVSQNKV